jgi:hypothetical protein
LQGGHHEDQAHRFARTLAVGLAAGALAAPAAGARPAPPDPPSQPPVVQSIGEGFDLGSAAIGAAGGGALMLLVTAAGITYRHRHHRVGVVR